MKLQSAWSFRNMWHDARIERETRAGIQTNFGQFAPFFEGRSGGLGNQDLLQDGGALAMTRAARLVHLSTEYVSWPVYCYGTRITERHGGPLQIKKVLCILKSSRCNTRVRVEYEAACFVQRSGRRSRMLFCRKAQDPIRHLDKVNDTNSRRRYRDPGRRCRMHWLLPRCNQGVCVCVCVCMEDLHGHPAETVECRREHSALL